MSELHLSPENADVESVPLIVDLDGTLIFTDMLHESAVSVVKNNPLRIFAVLFYLLQGKAVLKAYLAKFFDFSVEALPYNQPLIEWLKKQQLLGRKLILCTATDEHIAKRIAEHVGFFDEVIASNGMRNLAGKNKEQVLVETFGVRGFDYAGNSTADLKVWKSARKAIVVNASDRLLQQAAKNNNIAEQFPSVKKTPVIWLKTVRVHQWLKNLLLFVPVLAAHQLAEQHIWLTLLFAFMAFSLTASSVYILNDIMDLESDRLHPRKCRRPFASGKIEIWKGVLLAPLLLVVGMAAGVYVGMHFLGWLIVYFAITCAYSWGLKKLPLIDCITLTILYTLRVIAGGAAVGISLSFWLLAFSVFLFLSLAFVKRYAELEVQILNGKNVVHGRGYLTSDASLIQTLGVTSGYASVLVLALYLNSDAVLRLYSFPEAVWGAVVVMLFWVSWVWMQAHRGLMHDDPLVFAVKDKVSLFAGFVFALVLMIGTVGMP
jgi:4-hydroxybenzoate polyprenyltransferase/phosphoserine phosphatase